MQSINDALDKYDHVYVFSFENMRTAALKDLRTKLKEDRSQSDPDFDPDPNLTPTQTLTCEEGLLKAGTGEEKDFSFRTQIVQSVRQLLSSKT